MYSQGYKSPKYLVRPKWCCQPDWFFTLHNIPQRSRSCRRCCKWDYQMHNRKNWCFCLWYTSIRAFNCTEKLWFSAIGKWWLCVFIKLLENNASHYKWNFGSRTSRSCRRTWYGAAIATCVAPCPHMHRRWSKRKDQLC